MGVIVLVVWQQNERGQQRSGERGKWKWMRRGKRLIRHQCIIVGECETRARKHPGEISVLWGLLLAPSTEDFDNLRTSSYFSPT